jgi:hypothetical protein
MPIHCHQCDWWRQTEAAKGLCYANPPTIGAINVPHPITGHMQVGNYQARPATLEQDTCRHGVMKIKPIIAN